MNNFRLLKTAGVAVVALSLCGCGRDDGSRAYENGRAAFEANDFKVASRELERSLVLCKTNVDAMVYLSRVRIAMGELTSAKDWIARAQEQCGGDIDVKLVAAQVAWHAKNYDVASKGFAAIAADAKLPADIRAEGFTGLGIVEMTRNNREQARVAFLRAMRTDRRNAAAWYHLGLLYRDSYGYEEAALEQFNIFVRLDGASPSRVQKVQRVIIPELKEAIARAAAERPGALKRDSAASAELIRKAEIAWGKGNFKTAKQNYIEAMRNDALSYPAALGVAKAWLKTDATNKGLANAYEAYKQACQLKPGAISTFLTTADLAARLGYSMQAFEIYSRALAADPASISALDGIIRTLKRIGNRNATVQVYQTYRDSLAAKRR